MQSNATRTPCESEETVSLPVSVDNNPSVVKQERCQKKDNVMLCYVVKAITIYARFYHRS